MIVILFCVSRISFRSHFQKYSRVHPQRTNFVLIKINCTFHMPLKNILSKNKWLDWISFLLYTNFTESNFPLLAKLPRIFNCQINAPSRRRHHICEQKLGKLFHSSLQWSTCLRLHTDVRPSTGIFQFPGVMPFDSFLPPKRRQGKYTPLYFPVLVISAQKCQTFQWQRLLI